MPCWPRTHSGTHSQAATVDILSKFNLQALPIYKLHRSMVSSLQENHPPMTAVQKQTQNPSQLQEAKKLFLESPVISEKIKIKQQNQRQM